MATSAKLSYENATKVLQYLRNFLAGVWQCVFFCSVIYVQLCYYKNQMLFHISPTVQCGVHWAFALKSFLLHSRNESINKIQQEE